MGYSFAMSTGFKRADQVARFRSDKFFSEGYRLVASRVVGNHFWGLVETIATGKKYIWLGLMMGGGRNMGWGYKSMDEFSGPYHYDCPLSLLEQASELEGDGGYALKWREKVRQYHTDKKVKAKMCAGTVISYNNSKYKLDENVGRRGWYVTDVDTGAKYRMSARQVNQSKIEV
jgi:hypothetical protein